MKNGKPAGWRGFGLTEHKVILIRARHDEKKKTKFNDYLFPKLVIYLDEILPIRIFLRFYYEILLCNIACSLMRNRYTGI